MSKRDIRIACAIIIFLFGIALCIFAVKNQNDIIITIGLILSLISIFIAPPNPSDVNVATGEGGEK